MAPERKACAPSRREMMKGCGKVATGAVLGAAVVGAIAVAPANPDALLIAAFRRWIAQEWIIAAAPGAMSDDDFAALCHPAEAIRREIAEMPASTVTGLAIKVYLDRVTTAEGHPARVEIEQATCSALADVTRILQSEGLRPARPICCPTAA